MNLQALMKQAQSMQKDILKIKEEINNKVYESKNSFVTVKAKGTKEIIDVKIELESCDKDDIEMIQDLILVATNNVFEQIDKETEEKMGKYNNMMPGMF